MAFRGRTAPIAAGLVVSSLAVVSTARALQDKTDKDQSKRPRLNLRAQPAVGIAPARVVLTAELVGGSNDFEEFYCPALSWEWGDDTVSESETDCPPYEPGKSEIKRRYSTEHVFRRSGAYKVFVRLKQRSHEVAATSTLVQVQAGAQER